MRLFAVIEFLVYNSASILFTLIAIQDQFSLATEYNDFMPGHLTADS